MKAIDPLPFLFSSLIFSSLFVYHRWFYSIFFFVAVTRFLFASRPLEIDYGFHRYFSLFIENKRNKKREKTSVDFSDQRVMPEELSDRWTHLEERHLTELNKPKESAYLRHTFYINYNGLHRIHINASPYIIGGDRIFYLYQKKASKCHLISMREISLATQMKNVFCEQRNEQEKVTIRRYCSWNYRVYSSVASTWNSREFKTWK